MKQINREQFIQAEEHWDLKNLYADLKSVKGRNLTPMEKIHLRGLLSGYSPTEIAEKLYKTVEGLEVDLSNTLYQYIKELVGKNDEKIGNWRDICNWLDEAGYVSNIDESARLDKKLDTKINISNIKFNKNLDAEVNISNINFEGDKIEIGVLIQLINPLSKSE